MGHYPAVRYLEFKNDKLYCLSNKNKYGFFEKNNCSTTNLMYMIVVPSGRKGKNKNDYILHKPNCPEYISYIYRSSINPSSYTLEYCLEEDLGGVKSGIHFATPESVANP